MKARYDGSDESTHECLFLVPPSLDHVMCAQNTVVCLLSFLVALSTKLEAFEVRRLHLIQLFIPKVYTHALHTAGAQQQFDFDNRLLCNRKIEFPKARASYFFHQYNERFCLKDYCGEYCDLLCVARYRLNFCSKAAQNVFTQEGRLFVSCDSHGRFVVLMEMTPGDPFCRHPECGASISGSEIHAIGFIGCLFLFIPK